MTLRCEPGRISQLEAQLGLCAERSASGTVNQKVLVSQKRLTKVILDSQYREFWEMRKSPVCGKGD
jgi:hypothetical protein